MDERDARILRLLSSSKDYVSGENLSQRLGISRSAVWKRLKSLREKGFPVSALPSRGYMLDKSENMPFSAGGITAGLTTEFIGRKIFFYKNLESTNSTALELARRGEPEGTVVIADSQEAGRGRLGRSWLSPPGVNLYTSIILRPAITPTEAQTLTLLVAVAVAGTVESFIPVRPALKWPNDILVTSRKVAGILMEMDAEADRVNSVVAGIGVNINMPPRAFPPSLRGRATSLAEKRGGPISRVAFARALFLCLEKWYKRFLSGGPAPVLDAWRGYFGFEGKKVTVRGPGQTITGLCMGVASDGALLLRRPDGETVRVLAGDVECGG